MCFQNVGYEFFAEHWVCNKDITNCMIGEGGGGVMKIVQFLILNSFIL